jgi:hypothetical protein
MCCFLQIYWSYNSVTWHHDVLVRTEARLLEYVSTSHSPFSVTRAPAEVEAGVACKMSRPSENQADKNKTNITATLLHWSRRSPDSSVGIATDDGQGGRVSILSRGKSFCLLHSMQSGSGLHPATSPLGKWSKECQDVKLATHVHLILKLRMPPSFRTSSRRGSQLNL